MLPYKRDKIDLSKLSPEEQRLFALHGKIPPHKGLKKMQERKYLDGGGFFLSKAGENIVRIAIPNPVKYVGYYPSASSPAEIHWDLSIFPTNNTSVVNESFLAPSEEEESKESDKKL